MSAVFGLFMVLIVIACVLLVIVIMAQNPKGGGLSGTFGGSSAASFGVQRTNDFMDKSTWGLGIFIVVLIMLSVVMTGKPETIPAPQNAPASGATQGQSQSLPSNSETTTVPVNPGTAAPSNAK